jgi:anaerobic selenocysteine-containing dehydrogenase
MTSRRIFLKSISQIAAVSVVGLPLASQAAVAKVDEKDPQAAALGYKDDTKQVDKQKYSTHDVSQTCGNCQLYQGGGAASGPCPIFSGKTVEATGWCSAYTKRAGS